MPWTVKVLFAFNGQAQGWAEQFSVQSASGDLSAVAPIVNVLAQKRAKLLASTYVLQVVRCSIIIDNNGNRVLRQSTLAEPNYPGVQAWAPATPNLALLTEWSNATDTATKKQYLRGIPAGLGDEGKKPDFASATAAAWTSNWNAWTSAMVNYPCGWIGTTVTATAVINAYTIDATTGQASFILNAPGIASFASSIGYPVRIYNKLPGKNPLDGPQTVIPTSTTTCFTVKGIPAPPLPTGQLGIMTTRGPGFVSLAPVVQGGPSGSIDPQRIVSHKTGRPTYASRGRRPAVVRW